MLEATLREFNIVDFISLIFVGWMFARLIKAVVQTVIFYKRSFNIKKMYEECFRFFISKKTIIRFDSPLTIRYGKFELTFKNTKEGLRQFETCIVETLEYCDNMCDLAAFGENDEDVIKLKSILLKVQNKLRMFEEKG